MKYFDQYMTTDDLKAESLITAMLESDLDCEVDPLGSFFRNYCEDIIEIRNDLNSDSYCVELSRDGIYHSMPEALFFPENSLVNVDVNRSNRKSDFISEAVLEEIKKQNHEKNVLQVFFRFFDTQYFNTSLKLENQVYEIEKHKIYLILKHCFDFDLENETNPFIKKLAPFLIHASEIRGNTFFIQQLLSVILNHRVEIKRQLICIDNLPELISGFSFIVHIDGLSLKEYKELNMVYEPFFCFVNEWFLQAEAEFSFKIKDKNQRFILEKPLILDYNTQLK